MADKERVIPLKYWKQDKIGNDKAVTLEMPDGRYANKRLYVPTEGRFCGKICEPLSVGAFTVTIPIEEYNNVEVLKFKSRQKDPNMIVKISPKRKSESTTIEEVLNVY